MFAFLPVFLLSLSLKISEIVVFLLIQFAIVAVKQLNVFVHFFFLGGDNNNLVNHFSLEKTRLS